MKINCAYKKLVKVADLVKHPRNPNTHSPKQIELLAKILKSTGFRSPIVVSERSGFIVKGHGRLESAIKAGFDSVPVDVQNYESEAEEWSDMIADNRIAELSELDSTTLKDLLEELDTGENDLDLTGFDSAELERLMSQFHQYEVNEVGLPELDSGDKSPFQQKTFTLHDEQIEEVDASIRKAKEMGHGSSTINENSNGNALAFVCQFFNRQNP